MASRIEIVAPAGDYESFLAAVSAGADAVYLGIKGFGARRKATNFYPKELEDVIDYAHLRGVKVYITLNTLMKDIEIESLYENLKFLYEIGADAFIIQDLGLFFYIRTNFPDITIHASTQMTITNHEDAEILYKEGFKRVVLARELSFEEIKNIKDNTTIELEVFVSGALCVCYSGKCYFSSMIGGRSGNRGLCAQPCRKKYIDNEGKEGYFLSPKDQLLDAEEIKKMKKIGINSIKIEGRMKNNLYIYETVKYYRNIVDEIDKDNISNTIKLFNRGYSKGYFYGKDSELINKEYSSDYGYKIGEYNKRRKEIVLESEIMLGDGIAFVDENKNIIKGDYVNLIDYIGEKQKKAYPPQSVKLPNIPIDTKYVYKNFDKELNDNILKEIKQKKRKKGIKGEINIITDKKMNLKLYCEEVSAFIEKDIVTPAKKNILKDEDIFSKISELGETSFELIDLNINYDKKGFVSFGMLKDIKRECIEILEKNLKKYYKRDLKINKKNLEIKEKTKKIPIISACISNEKQYDVLKRMGVDKIYYKENIIKKEFFNKKDNFIIANKLCKLVSNISDIDKKGEKVSIDWTFNTFNSYTLEYLSKYKDNIDTVYLSPEMSFEEIEKINSTQLSLGVVVYGKILLMYTEMNLFETDNLIKNENKDLFEIKINKNNNTEIYTDKPLNIITKIDMLGDYGVSEVRLDFTFETDKEIENIIKSIKGMSFDYVSYNYEKGVL